MSQIPGSHSGFKKPTEVPYFPFHAKHAWKHPFFQVCTIGHSHWCCECTFTSTNKWQRAYFHISAYRFSPAEWETAVKCCFWRSVLSVDGTTTGRQGCSANWIIHGYRESQSQGIKGMCKQLNKNKTFTAVWTIAGCSVNTAGRKTRGYRAERKIVLRF